VHAVEASATLGRRLNADITRNGLTNRITVHNQAVSDYEGQAWLQRGWHDPAPDASRFISQSSATPGSVRVEVTTLDKLLANESRIDIVKLDIEGEEVAALRGMVATLNRCRPRLLLIEVQGSTLALGGACRTELFELMDGYGYSSEHYDSPFHGTMVAFRTT
jgi:FkbM family methyltransferase